MRFVVCGGLVVGGWFDGVWCCLCGFFEKVCWVEEFIGDMFFVDVQVGENIIECLYEGGWVVYVDVVIVEWQKFLEGGVCQEVFGMVLYCVEVGVFCEMVVEMYGDVGFEGGKLFDFVVQGMDGFVVVGVDELDGMVVFLCQYIEY